MAKINKMPQDWQLRVCTITLGEIQAGHLVTQTTDQQQRDDFLRFLNANFLHHALCISIHTRHKYAKVLYAILTKYPLPNKKTKTERHLVTNLGIDINDVWIAASAWEHNLTLVTQDKMTYIKEAVGSEVQFDCWL